MAEPEESGHTSSARDRDRLIVTLPDGSRYEVPMTVLAAYRVDPGWERLFRDIRAEPMLPGLEYGEEDIGTRKADRSGATDCVVEGVLIRRRRATGNPEPSA